MSEPIKFTTPEHLKRFSTRTAEKPIDINDAYFCSHSVEDYVEFNKNPHETHFREITNPLLFAISRVGMQKKVEFTCSRDVLPATMQHVDIAIWHEMYDEAISRVVSYHFLTLILWCQLLLIIPLMIYSVFFVKKVQNKYGWETFVQKFNPILEEYGICLEVIHCLNHVYLTEDGFKIYNLAEKEKYERAMEEERKKKKLEEARNHHNSDEEKYDQLFSHSEPEDEEEEVDEEDLKKEVKELQEKERLEKERLEKERIERISMEEAAYDEKSENPETDEKRDANPEFEKPKSARGKGSRGKKRKE